MKKCVSFLLALVLVFSLLPAGAWAAEEEPSVAPEVRTQAEDAPAPVEEAAPAAGPAPAEEPSQVIEIAAPADAAMSDAEAVAAIYAEFNNTRTYGSAANTPIVLPCEYEGTQYTNVLDYIKAWARKNTGREAAIEYKVAGPAITITEWKSGNKEKYQPVVLQENGDIVQNEYGIDDAANYRRMQDVYFTVGEQRSQKINSIYVKAEVKQRTPQEIVEYIVSNLPFERICGNNADAQHIVQPIGEKSTTGVGALPTLSTTGVDKDQYSKSKANVEWSLVCNSGNTSAISLASNKTTILRPNVDEEDAKFTLTAKVSSVERPEITGSKDYELTVPHFEGVETTFKIPEGAVLSLTDGYYKVPVKDTLIRKQGAEDGYDSYVCRLHAAATGTRQSFSYTVTKEGYLTKTGTVYVVSDPQTVTVDLVQSTENDIRLKTLTLDPAVEGFRFDPNVFEYTIEVSGVPSIKVGGTAAADGAAPDLTYCSTAANASKDPPKTTKKKLSAAGTPCYLSGDITRTTDIVITIAAPAGSILEGQTGTYTIHVKKTGRDMLTGLTVSADSTSGGTKNISSVTPKEEVDDYMIVPGTSIGTYYVNYWRDQITVTPKAVDGATIKINDETVPSGADSQLISLKVGDNEIPISVTKDNDTANYTLTVHRKDKLILTDIQIDGGQLTTGLAEHGENWTAQTNFPHDAQTVNMTYFTNVEDGSQVNVSVTVGGQVYSGKAGTPIAVPVGDVAESTMTYVGLSRTVDGVQEMQVYIIGMYRKAASSASGVESYLPAPGQFVNLNTYANPERTVAGSGMITLGAFGGNVVYRFDQPIRNDPKNPYGIDFLIMGNAFANSDNSTAAGAAEPAAVMVSEDGVTWYELAGSEYYAANTRHNLTVTYQNGDTTFSAAAPTPWTDSGGGSGTLPVVDAHKQAYFPNPSTYSAYQGGIGKNSTYTASSVSFTGTQIESGFYPFGYADSHTEAAALGGTGPKGSTAANPYAANHGGAGKFNGDGFDLAWAVDENGDPVTLSSVKYVKVYNPVMQYGGSTGEKSPEISTILRAEPAASDVGVSGELMGLTVNGESVALRSGVHAYTVDAKGASSLAIVPTAASGANIYVSNQRVDSGGTTAGLTAVEKLRILVQEGDKAPVIYILNIRNIPGIADNADLASLTLTPGDDTRAPDGENRLAFTVDSALAAVRLTAVPAADKAAIALSGGRLTGTVPLSKGVSSPSLPLDVGENVFALAVTAPGGTARKEYAVTITRASEPQRPESATRVTFSLTGDTVHYDMATGTYTGSHTAPVWVPATEVTVPAGSTVKYLTEMVLNNSGLDYTSDGAYISEINGLAEFDNGPNSGWMYRHNRVLASEGYADRVLANGDTVSWFYTDDYTKETGYDGSWDNVNAGDKPAEEKPSLAPAVTPDKSGTAKVEISPDAIRDAVADAKRSGAGEIVIVPQVEGAADKVTVELEKSSVDAVAKQTGADLTVRTDAASVTIPQESLDGLAEGGGSKVSVSVGTGKDGRTDIEVAVDGKAVERLRGGLKVELPARKGGDVLVAVGPDGTETVVKKSVVEDGRAGALLEGSCSIKVVDNRRDFDDVRDGAWYTEAVNFAGSHELFDGVAEKRFAPDDAMTRGMLATVLWQLENGEAAAAPGTFTDVAEGSWYEAGIVWASEHGIVTGYGGGLFGPADDITREQMAVLLWRYAGDQGLDVTASGDLTGFADGGAVSGYAADAMRWAVGAGLLQGTGVHVLDPQGGATRAQVAAVMQRLVGLIVGQPRG